MVLGITFIIIFVNTPYILFLNHYPTRRVQRLEATVKGPGIFFNIFSIIFGIGIYF